MSTTMLIHEVHDMWPATLIELGGMKKSHPFIKLMQRAEDYAYKKCDSLVSIPPYAKEYMICHGLSEEKYNKIPNGVVLEDWENPLSLPKEIENKLDGYKAENKFIVGYFGGHAQSNALDILLDSARLLVNYEDIIFVLVGKGIEKARLIQRKQDENIQNVVFFDALDKRCIPNLLKKFDCIYIGALKSSLYRFGIGANKLYDSMMAAKPIVLSATTPKTIVELYDCGIVVDAEDINQIGKAILTIRQLSQEEREKLGINGRKAIEREFTYGKLASDFEKLMDIEKEREKKILLINHYAGSPEMGMEFRPYYFAREWVKKGHKVDIIAADYSHLRIKNPVIRHDFEEEMIDDIRYHWVHTSTYNGNGGKRALTMFQFVSKLWINAKKIAGELEPDVIITSSTYPLDIYAGQRIKMLVKGEHNI